MAQLERFLIPTIMAKRNKETLWVGGEELKGRMVKVYKVMLDNESARNNDWTLMAHYIKRYYSRLIFEHDGDWCIKLKSMKKLPSWQSIRLSRQVLQNEKGLVLPTDPKVTKVRRLKEKSIKEVEYREAVQYKL